MANPPFFRQKHPVTISFAAGILLFLLPFAELKCGGVTLASNSGIGIAIGAQWNVAMGDSTKDLLGKLDDKGDGEVTRQLGEMGPNLFAIISLVAGVIGLIFYLSVIRHRYLISMCAGILAAVMMLGIMIAFRVTLANALTDDSANAAVNRGLIKLIKINFTAWYYLSMLAFITAAFLNYKHYKQELEDAMAASVDFEFQRQTSTLPGSTQ